MQFSMDCLRSIDCLDCLRWSVTSVWVTLGRCDNPDLEFGGLGESNQVIVLERDLLRSFFSSNYDPL